MENGLYTDDEIREMFKGLPAEELEWALQHNRETRQSFQKWDDALQEVADVRQITAEMIADDYAEEAAEIQADLDEVARQQAEDNRKEEQHKRLNVLPWKKSK